MRQLVDESCEDNAQRRRALSASSSLPPILKVSDPTAGDHLHQQPEPLRPGTQVEQPDGDLCLEQR
jgi:hypothetical protein